MYNESDLKTIWYAQKGGMKNYQLTQLMGISEDECEKMLAEAKRMFAGVRREKEEIPKRPYYKQKVRSEKSDQPMVRPEAKYDNKSHEEVLNYYLSI